jgi:hypothetical protein
MAAPATPAATAIAGAMAASITGSSSVSGKTINPTNRRRRYVGTIVIISGFKSNFAYQWFQVSGVSLFSRTRTMFYSPLLLVVVVVLVLGCFPIFSTNSDT